MFLYKNTKTPHGSSAGAAQHVNLTQQGEGVEEHRGLPEREGAGDR